MSCRVGLGYLLLYLTWFGEAAQLRFREDGGVPVQHRRRILLFLRRIDVPLQVGDPGPGRALQLFGSDFFTELFAGVQELVHLPL